LTFPSSRDVPKIPERCDVPTPKYVSFSAREPIRSPMLTSIDYKPIHTGSVQRQQHHALPAPDGSVRQHADDATEIARLCALPH
jgi:hypothetical protein